MLSSSSYSSSATDQDDDLMEVRLLNASRKKKKNAMKRKDNKIFHMQVPATSKTPTTSCSMPSTTTCSPPIQMEDNDRQSSPHSSDSFSAQATFSASYSSSSSSSSSEEDFSSQCATTRLYNKSTLTVSEFVVLFLACVGKLAIAETHCDMLLNFIRLLLPMDNNLPLSYRRIRKLVSEDGMKKLSLCSICFRELSKFKLCPSETCLSNRRPKTTITTICVASKRTQIANIVSRNISAINSYLGKQLINIISLKDRSY